jgi:hypothetical protein
MSKITDVNAREWPVPLPPEVTLEDVRNELINLGSEYVWLDILCLRQASDYPGETLRADEWAIDVPTIGQIYQKSDYVVRYFNGLEREFSRSGWDDARHWSQRAWTLQEFCQKPTIDAGIYLGCDTLDTYSEEDPGLTLRAHIGSYSPGGQGLAAISRILHLPFEMAKKTSFKSC